MMNIALYLSIYLQLSTILTYSVPVNTTETGIVDTVTTQQWKIGGHVTSVGPAENEDPLHIIYHGTVSLEQQRLIEFIFITSKCLLPIVCIIGVLGNMLSLAVFIKQGPKLRPSTRVYLRTLCVADIVYLTLTLSQAVIENYVDVGLSLNSKIIAYKNLYLRPLNMSAGGVSSVLVVIISMERFLAICFPMLNRVGMVFQRYPKVPVFIACMVHLTVYILIMLSRNITVYFDPIHQVPMWRYGLTKFGQKGDFLKILGTTLELFYGPGTVALVLVFNIAIIVRLQMAAQERKKMTHGTALSNTSESQTNYMLLGIALLYLICIMPNTIRSLLWFLHPDFAFYGKEHFLSLTLRNISRVTVVSNSSANILVYVLASASFRATLMSLKCCRKSAAGKLSVQDKSNITGRSYLSTQGEDTRE